VTLRRVAIGTVAASAAYLMVLLIAGWVASERVAETVRDRLAASLDGEARVAHAEVGLVRGEVVVTGVTARREQRGVLQLAVERLEVDVAPLGAVIFDRTPRALRLSGGHLLISGAGALDGLDHRRRAPLRVGAVELVDSDLTIVATTMWPELARVHLTITRVVAGPTTFRTPLSWVFSLRELAARVELPGGAAFTLTFHDGALSAQGSLFGDIPITVPVSLAYRPGVPEPVQLRAIAFELGKRLALERARRWFWNRALRSAF